MCDAFHNIQVLALRSRHATSCEHPIRNQAKEDLTDHHAVLTCNDIEIELTYTNTLQILVNATCHKLQKCTFATLRSSQNCRDGSCRNIDMSGVQQRRFLFNPPKLMCEGRSRDGGFAFCKGDATFACVLGVSWSR